MRADRPVRGAIPVPYVTPSGGSHLRLPGWEEEAAVIESAVLERVLGEALRHGGEFAEVFAEDRATSSSVLDDGRVEELSSGRERGAGIRVVVGETTGFAHTADLTEAGLLRAAEAASGVARRGQGGVATASAIALPHTGSSGWPDDTDEDDRAAGDDGAAVGSGRLASKADSLEILRRADDAARATGAAISQVQAGCGSSRRRVLVANSDGLLAADDQWRTRFSVSCVAVGDTGLQTGFETAARTLGAELFEEVSVEELAEQAARRALAKLAARPAPSGELPVVLAGGSGGILFHEACGHGLEADHIVKEASVYVGRVGEQVASPLVTLVDDGTVGSEWGNLRHRRRGEAGSAQRPHRPRGAHRLLVGLPPVPPGGHAARRATVVARATSTCRWSG